MGAYRATYFLSKRYHSDMNIDKSSEQLWHRLENEPRRAFEAFQTFLSLPNGARTIVEAYRSHVDNPQATKASDTWAKWTRTFAWSERAAAYDAHLDRIRERSIEKATEEEAKRQTREAERTRYRYNVLMTAAYHRTMECLEDDDWVSSNLRASDVLNITRLYMGAVKAFEVDRESTVEDDWEEDDAEFDEIVKEVDAQTDLERPDGEEEDGEDSENTERDLE